MIHVQNFSLSRLFYHIHVVITSLISMSLQLYYNFVCSLELFVYQVLKQFGIFKIVYVPGTPIKKHLVDFVKKAKLNALSLFLSGLPFLTGCLASS